MTTKPYTKDEPKPWRRASDFRIGQRVKLSAYAAQQGITLQSRAKGRGSVVAVREPFSVKVQPDTYATAGWFNADFWEPSR
jgi:hypothetical protein